MIRSFFVLFVLSISVFAYSQDTNSVEKESLTITIKPKYGFSLGADYSLVKNYSSSEIMGMQPSSINNAHGFRLGIFGDIKIQNRFTLMPKAEISFNNTTVQENNKTYNLDPVNLDFLLHAKINFIEREKKFNPYCTFGSELRVSINSNA